jgi:hypothetical protein
MSTTKQKFYHSGTDSFDNPQIKEFEEGQQPSGFGFGPFVTFQAAKKDMVEMLSGDILNLKYCLANVNRIKGPSKRKSLIHIIGARL